MLIRQKQKKEEGENPLPLFLLFTEHSLVNFSYMRKFLISIPRGLQS